MKLLAAILLCAGLALPAGEPTGFHQWNASTLKETAATLAAKVNASGAASSPLATLQNYSFSAILRRSSGGAEIHKTNNDLFVVQSGEATLIVGGAIPDASESQPNEVRGTSIVGGVEKKIAAGDIVTIPAGMPHQMNIEKGKEIVYIAIKIAKP